MNTNEQFDLNKCPICKNALKYHTETPIEVPPEAPLYNPINIFINNGLINLLRHNGLEDDDDLRNNGLEDDDDLRNNGLEDDDDLSNKYDIDYSIVIKDTFIQLVIQFPLMLMWAHSFKDAFLSK